MTNRKKETMRGNFVEEDGVVYAVSQDSRFVTSGRTAEEALAMMRDLVDGYHAVAMGYGFTPYRKLSDEPVALDYWELVPVLA